MRHWLITVMLGACLYATAGTTLIPDMKFRRLDTRDGLSNSQVNCIFRDSRGFVWFGTPYGLNRYDGYRFHTFYSNIRDTTSMRDNYTDQIYEAHDGKLWLKQGMNYCIYDPVTETFERNVSRTLGKLGLNGGVERIFIDSKKRLWVKLYEQGLFCYNPKTKQCVQFKLGYEKNQFNPSYGISYYAEEGDNVIITTNCGEMLCLDGEKGNILWENKWIRENGGVENQDYKPLVDKFGNYWVVSQTYTFIYDKHNGQWYKSVPDLLRARGFENVPEQMNVWAVAEDSHGWIWAAADHDGLFVIDLKDRQLRQFLSSKYDETTISDNTLRHIYRDPFGQMWLGSYKNGVNQYKESLSSFRNVEDLGDINAVCEDRHGYYWVGTNDRGIIVYDPRTGEQVRHYTTANSGLSSNVLVGGTFASDGTIWFGSYNGGLVHCIPSADDPTLATIVNYRTTGRPDDLANNNVWSVTEDKWKRIWIGTLGNGVQLLDPKTGKFRTWDSTNSGMASDYLTTINWTRKGWLLAGTSYYYTLINPVSGKLVNQQIPEDPNVTVVTSATIAVMEDSRGLIWQGSTSGVCVYDAKHKQVQLLDMTRGLLGSSVCSILEDKSHNMWVVTDHGVSNIVPVMQPDSTWQYNVRSFSSRDGLQQSTYNQRSSWLTRDGLVLVGGQNGLDIINPRQLSDAKSTERPIFSGLQLFDEDVAVGQKVNGRVILDEALDVCRELDLRYYDQFTILLATNESGIKNQSRFAYRLEGFNENWIKTSEQNPSITYSSLRPGTYTLCVRMLNDDGTIGDEESQLEITIHPPLWRTRWMILLYMLLIAVVAWLWRRRFLRRQAERMEELRRQLTDQLTSQQPEAPEASDGPETSAAEPVVDEVIHEAEVMEDDEE